MLNALVRMPSRAVTIVEALTSGETGFARTMALNPDILILGISLPDISGPELAKRLRSAGWREDRLPLS